MSAKNPLLSIIASLVGGMTIATPLSGCAVRITDTSLTIGPSARITDSNFNTLPQRTYSNSAISRNAAQLQSEIKLLNAQLEEATQKLISARRSKQWACDEKLYDSRTSGYIILNHYNCKPLKKSFQEAQKVTEKLRYQISTREIGLKRLGWAQFPDGSFKKLAVNGEAQKAHLAEQLADLQLERARLLAEEKALDREIRSLGNRSK